MKKAIVLADMNVKQLCDLFNDSDNICEEYGISSNDIIHEFINRKISTVNIQRASGSAPGKKMRIWYNDSRNCIEVYGRNFFEGTDLLQW